MRVILATSCLAFLLGCATPYQPAGFRGGYDQLQLDANTFRVEFRGNGYARRQRVDTYLLYRCAELTVQQGYDYFVTVSGETDTSIHSFTTPGSFSATTTHSGYSSHTTGTIMQGQTYRVRKHEGVAVIKMFKGEKSSDHPAAFDAKELMHFLQQQSAELLEHAKSKEQPAKAGEKLSPG